MGSNADVSVMRSRSDVFSRHKRSQIMAAVKTSGTAPEVLLASMLNQLRLRFRRNARDLAGSPDIVLDRPRIAIFVDGDFWHGRAWFERRAAPKQNKTFWIAKFEINRTRDLRCERLLRRHGWSVVRLWASDLKKKPDVAVALIEERRKKRTQRRARTKCR